MIARGRRRFRNAAGLTAALLVLAGCSHSSGRTTRHHLPAGLAGVGDLPSPASAWPQAGYDARHSSATNAVGPHNAHVRWRRELGGDATPGPVIGVDGNVLAATNSGVLRALDPATGRVVWTFDAHGSYGSDLSTSPAVLGDGTILWPGPENTLFALSRSGNRLWSVTSPAQILSPAVAGAHRVYLADLAGNVTALEVTPTSHRTVWRLALGGTDYASPTVGPEGTVYTASDHDLVAVRDLGASGRTLWRFHATQTVEVSNPVTAKGVVVLGTNGDMEYGISSTGSVRWSFDARDYTYSSAIARPNGVGWFGDNTGRLRTIDVDTGRVRSTVAPLGNGREKIWTAPVADARNNVYWATTAGNVYGYDARGVKLFALATRSSINSYPALGADGTLYVATTSGTLYAIGP